MQYVWYYFDFSGSQSIACTINLLKGLHNLDERQIRDHGRDNGSYCHLHASIFWIFNLTLNIRQMCANWSAHQFKRKGVYGLVLGVNESGRFTPYTDHLITDVWIKEILDNNRPKVLTSLTQSLGANLLRANHRVKVGIEPFKMN